MPDFVREALAAEGLVESDLARPPCQRNGDPSWIGRAKRADTRRQRLAQMLEEPRRGDVYMTMAWKPLNRR